MSGLRTSLTRTGPGADEAPVPWFGRRGPRPPIEAKLIRGIGVVWLALVVAGIVFTRPRVGLHGEHAAILAALVVLIASVLWVKPWGVAPAWRRVAALVGLTAAAAVLAALQPNGTWQNGPLLVAIIGALWLDRLAGAAMLAFSVVVLATVLVADHHAGQLGAVVFTAVPWFIVMRLMREIAVQRNELRASREAEAEAAAVAERARLAREMHDVLAHSLSALALQLESTRMLAADRGVDKDVTRAIDQAHELAASGLQEARRAIATARGDEQLPGPDRIGVLADEFAEQSGLPVALAVRGEPRRLAPDARLALYRTAQEALTNVRRHAAAERVAIELSYLTQRTVLVVEDWSSPGTPPPPPLAGAGYGLTGMRERAELLGGELLAEPTDTGFRVELRLPP